VRRRWMSWSRKWIRRRSEARGGGQRRCFGTGVLRGFGGVVMK
jgi:hypothetical protein